MLNFEKFGGRVDIALFTVTGQVENISNNLQKNLAFFIKKALPLNDSKIVILKSVNMQSSRN